MAVARSVLDGKLLVFLIEVKGYLDRDCRRAGFKGVYNHVIEDIV